MAAGFCFATWMLSATPTPALISCPSSLGLFRPSDKNTGRYVISMQLVHEVMLGISPLFQLIDLPLNPLNMSLFL